MNPTLTQWLTNYANARALHEEETRAVPAHRTPPAAPPEMQFTITSTGLLRDVDGARLGHISELADYHLPRLGINPDTLTARQRTPRPSRARTPQPATDATPANPLSGLNLTGIPDGAIQPLPLRIDPSPLAAAAAAMSASVASVGTATHAAMEVMAANLPGTQVDARTGLPREAHAGPQMLATLSTETGSADRYAEHTGDSAAALNRAQHVFIGRDLYATTASRLGAEQPRPSFVGRTAVQVGIFMNRAYGIEFNDETLTAVAAMTSVFARQAAARQAAATARADAAETHTAALRTNVAALEAELNRTRAARGTDAVTGEARVALIEARQAARAWKETPVTESVARRDTFLTLLDTLDRLAQ
jgi:hypothetical protein